MLLLSLPYYLFAEWACFVVSILFLLKYRSKFLLATSIYLSTVVLVETACFFISGDNNWVYNLDMPIEFAFVTGALSSIIYRQKVRAAVVLYALFFISFGTEWIIRGTLSMYFTISYITGSAIVISLCIKYYYHSFQEETYSNILDAPFFWFVSGCLLYYTTSIPFTTFFDQLNGVFIGGKIALGEIILNVSSLILYCSWIVSFICLTRNQIFP